MNDVMQAPFETVRRIAWLKRPGILIRETKKAEDRLSKYENGHVNVRCSSLDYRPEQHQKGIKYSRVEDQTEKRMTLQAEMMDAANAEYESQNLVLAAYQSIESDEVRMAFENEFGMIPGVKSGHKWKITKKMCVQLVLENISLIVPPEEYIPNDVEILEANRYLTGKSAKREEFEEDRVRKLTLWSKANEVIRCYKENKHLAYASYVRKTQEREAAGRTIDQDKDKLEESAAKAEKKEKKHRAAAMCAKQKIQDALKLMPPGDRHPFIVYYINTDEDLYRTSMTLNLSKARTAAEVGRSFQSFKRSIEELNAADRMKREIKIETEINESIAV